MSADGRAVDLEIAKFMGWRETSRGHWTHDKTRQWSVDQSHIPKYSKSIKAAFQVVEKMLKDGWSYDIGGREGSHKCAFGMFPAVYEDTLPLAICKAALRSLAPGAGKENV